MSQYGQVILSLSSLILYSECGFDLCTYVTLTFSFKKRYFFSLLYAKLETSEKDIWKGELLLRLRSRSKILGHAFLHIKIYKFTT